MTAAAGDTAIQRLIERTRVRIRIQWALEGATTATVLAASAALAVVFALRAELVDKTTGMALLIGAGSLIVIGAVWSALRKLDDETVARRIDRASNLSDRLSTAIAFRRELATAPAADDETTELMLAAIRDGERAAPRANIRAAAPFVAPRDWRAALGFLAVSALAAGLAIPTIDRTPHVHTIDPDKARPGQAIALFGDHMTPDLPGPAPKRGVFLGAADAPLAAQVLEWTGGRIRVRIPDTAPHGLTTITMFIGPYVAGPFPFEVIDPRDESHFKDDAVVLDPDERAYVERILQQLRDLARRDQVPELEDFANKIEKLLKDSEEGKVTKEELLAALRKAEELLEQGKEPAQTEIDKQLGELGKELAKNDLTKQLGDALQKQDLERAKEELEELARKLDTKEQAEQQKELEKQKAETDAKQQELEKKKAELEKKLAEPNLSEQQKQELQKQLEAIQKQLQEQAQKQQSQQKKLDQMKQEKPLTEQQKESLQKQLEQTSEQMKKQQQAQQQQAEQQQKKLEEEVRRLKKERDEAKNEKDKLDAERRLQKKQDELKQLQKNEQDKQQSAQREAIKRLQRNVEQAAESLEKPKTKEESEQEQEQRERQASQKLKDAARETGRVDQDKRKRAAQRKATSQMDDLREAMQRAKQKGNKGQQDPFGKQGRNKDFAQRARGQKGQGDAWRPGQGQGGQGQNGKQPGGQGQGQGGQSWGTGHDPNLTDVATSKSGNTKDAELEASKHGAQGTSRRQTILAAAQKGFATKAYKDVYQKYERDFEEVMRNEKLPSSYKYYVKRYFAKIHPTGNAPEPTKDSATDTKAQGNP